MKQIYVIKILDGLYIGDRLAAKSHDFLIQNQISLIINCAASEICIFTQTKIQSLSFYWEDNDSQIILSQSDQQFNTIYRAIQQIFYNSEGVLICSVKGQSRSLTVTIALLMKKFRWTLYKTLEYINSKRNDLQLRPNFLNQLAKFQTRLFGINLQNCTSNWNEQQLCQEGNIIKNTFINSLKKMDGQSLIKNKKLSVSNKHKNVSFSDFKMIINGPNKMQSSVKYLQFKKNDDDIIDSDASQILQPKNLKKSFHIYRKNQKKYFKRIKTQNNEELQNLQKTKENRNKQESDFDISRKYSQIIDYKQKKSLLSSQISKKLSIYSGYTSNIKYPHQNMHRKSTFTRQNIKSYLQQLFPEKNLISARKIYQKFNQIKQIKPKQFRSSSTQPIANLDILKVFQSILIQQRKMQTQMIFIQLQCSFMLNYKPNIMLFVRTIF